MKYIKGLVIACSLGFLPDLTNAIELMPDFANVPTGWTTDRYEPASFSNVGTFQGRNNVLGITIDSSGNSANRPLGQQGTFYNTQGRQQVVSGGAGDALSADLWVPSTWSDAANGNVRSDMWGVMSDGSSVSDYPIIGFSNYGGAPRFRVWDSDLNAGAGDWVNLLTAVNLDSWNSFSIAFTGSDFVYSINGSVVYTDSTINGSAGFSATIMQAYNFADPSAAPGAVLADYTAHWSNSQQVPDVGGTWTLMGIGFMALAGLRSRFSVK